MPAAPEHTVQAFALRFSAIKFHLLGHLRLSFIRVNYNMSRKDGQEGAVKNDDLIFHSPVFNRKLQIRVSHQILVDLLRGLAALADCPDNE